MPEPARSRLQSFPIAWFSMVMGLAGLAIAWNRAEALLNLALQPSPVLLGLCTGLFLLIGALYSAKALRYREATAREWAHPVQMNFAPTFSISLILLSIAWLPVNLDWSRLLWAVGTVLQLALTLHILTQWLHNGKFEIVHLNPAWVLPVVGNLLVPIAGVAHAQGAVSWFFFSVGLTFWPVLLTIIVYRVIFHGSLPERLMPTLFILIAPPAVGFLSYLRLTDRLDAFAQVLYHGALFFTLVLLVQGRWFLRPKFSLSWWAYSFPLAAITIATLAMFHATGDGLFLRLSGLLLGITTVVAAGLFGRTLVAVFRRESCLED
jgi:tellurite resistance protein